MLMELPSEIDKLVDLAIDSLKSIFIKYNCDFAYLTGSYARNEQFKWSDLDIVVSNPHYGDLSAVSKLDYLLNITTEVGEALKFENIDLKIIETLPLHVQFSMINDGNLIFEVDENRRTDFIERLLNVYYDYAIWYENYLDMSLSGGNKS